MTVKASCLDATIIQSSTGLFCFSKHSQYFNRDKPPVCRAEIFDELCNQFIFIDFAEGSNTCKL
jgi:hypothetical protein